MKFPTLILLTLTALANAEPTTRPAEALLKQLGSTYLALHSATFDGRIIGHFDVGGQQKNEEVAFVSSFKAPNRFRFEAKDETMIGSDGTKAYVVQTKRNTYFSADAPKDRGELTDWPRVMVQMLQDEDPAMLLALTKNAEGDLQSLTDQMSQGEDVKLDGQRFASLQFELPDHVDVMFLIDPHDGLLRQARYDFRKNLEQRGANDVKTAEVIVDYTSKSANVELKDDQFAWTPPPGAIFASASGNAMDDQGSDSALLGKPAPDFSLSGLDDKRVKLSELKGSVVVLDFWATWCQPCMMSLPNLDQLYKDDSPKGLKVLAIDQKEDIDLVRGTVNEKKWTLTVLLDSDGAAGKQYGTDDGIPRTIIVGKDGVVKKAFLGTSDEVEQQIKSIVEDEMKK